MSGDPPAIKPPIYTAHLEGVEIRLAEERHLVALLLAQVDTEALVDVQAAVDVGRGGTEDFGRRHSNIALDVLAAVFECV